MREGKENGITKKKDKKQGMCVKWKEEGEEGKRSER